MNIERVRWMALVLAGALVLHLFMFTGVPQPRGDAATHAHGMADLGALPTSGHDAAGAHGAAEMLSTCFAVLALATAGVRSNRATRGKPSSYGRNSHAGPPDRQAGDATSRHGPSPASRVDAGVLLRV